MNLSNKKAYWAAMTNAAAMIESHGNEGSDFGTDEYTHEQYIKLAKRIAEKLFKNGDKLLAKIQKEESENHQ